MIGMDKIKMFLKLAYRNIVRERKRSALVMAAAGVGMLGILLTFSSMNGFFQAMISSGIDTGLAHVQIRPAGYLQTRKLGLVLEDGAAILARLRAINEKLSTPAATDAKFKYAPRLEREGLLRMGSFSRGVSFVGIVPELEKDVSSFKKYVIAGAFTTATDEKDRLQGIVPCIIGRENARKMEVDVGDTVILTLNDASGSSRSARARVTGIFQSPAEPVDKYVVLMGLADLSRLYAGESDKIGYFAFRGKSLSGSDSLKTRVKTALGAALPLSKYEVATHAELEPSIPGILNMADQFNWIVSVIMLIGFAFILFEGVMMSVFERMREIGIIRAIGARPNFLFWMVIFESILLTFLGCLGGIALAAGITFYFQFYGLSLAMFAKGMETFGRSGSVIYPFLTVKDLGIALFVSLIVSVIAGAFPAWKAVKISPVKAIFNR